LGRGGRHLGDAGHQWLDPRRAGRARWNLLHPTNRRARATSKPACPTIRDPVVAATDYMKLYAEQLRPFIPRHYLVLGTDGFGRSDTRAKLRQHFEVDRHYVAVAALKLLAEEGALPVAKVQRPSSDTASMPTSPIPLNV
jgi:pyruvate dehydrogenase E1 component